MINEPTRDLTSECNKLNSCESQRAIRITDSPKRSSQRKTNNATEMSSSIDRVHIRNIRKSAEQVARDELGKVETLEEKKARIRQMQNSIELDLRNIRMKRKKKSPQKMSKKKRLQNLSEIY